MYIDDQQDEGKERSVRLETVNEEGDNLSEI
jgi:hypothetical protein